MNFNSLRTAVATSAARQSFGAERGIIIVSGKPAGSPAPKRAGIGRTQLGSDRGIIIVSGKWGNGPVSGSSVKRPDGSERGIIIVGGKPATPAASAATLAIFSRQLQMVR